MNGMHETGERVFALRHIAAQHRELLHRLERLRDLLQAPVDDEQLSKLFDELRTRLDELRRLMEVHLVQEAEGGYLEEAVSRVPRLAAQADVLEAEHPHLLSDLTALANAAQKADPSFGQWRQIGAKFIELARRMLAHEAAENQLLHAGFNADPVLFD